MTLCEATTEPPPDLLPCHLQGGVHGEEQTPAGAAQRAEDGDRKPEAEGEGDAAGRHPQPERRARDQQAEQLQKGLVRRRTISQACRGHPDAVQQYCVFPLVEWFNGAETDMVEFLKIEQHGFG